MGTRRIFTIEQILSIKHDKRTTKELAKLYRTNKRTIKRLKEEPCPVVTIRHNVILAFD
jgi:hypothetical protein